MERREIVKKAIEFDTPPRLPFWQDVVDWAPSDVCDCWEMDRAKRGWFFDKAVEDDWGCGWKTTELKNMGQCVHHPLLDWAAMDTFRPPDPRDPFYFERIDPIISAAEDRYVVVTCHFGLIERLHMLHGFSETLSDLLLEPANIDKLLDMILEFKLEMIDELHRRFGDRIHGLFCTDDWGTQTGTFISGKLFEKFFLERYRRLVDAVHGHGWHFLLHSCGKINDFVPYFLDAGVDVLNMQQPRAYGIRELGRRFAGRMCFLTTADIQATMPTADAQLIREEVDELVENWSTREGGLIVFNYGFDHVIGTTRKATEAMFDQFTQRMQHWSG